jgi:hypothetical protein
MRTEADGWVITHVRVGHPNTNLYPRTLSLYLAGCLSTSGIESRNLLGYAAQRFYVCVSSIISYECKLIENSQLQLPLPSQLTGWAVILAHELLLPATRPDRASRVK